ncbi:DUF2612 domain-containing protein [Morganella morganii]
MIDIRETLLSQYANSPVITSILKKSNEAIDPRYSADEFYNLAVNVLTAQGFGLDIWGRIVGIGRGLSIPDPGEEYFGFSEAEEYEPFDQAPFFGGISNQSTYQMDDETYREVIIIKAYANILCATAPNINSFLKSSFTRGRAYYLITGHMTAWYVFEYELSDLEKNLIYNQNILPRPSGVEINISEDTGNEVFGFGEAGYEPFDQAPFMK